MYQRGYKVLGRMTVLLLAIPVLYFVLQYSIGYVAGPTLYDGDRLEERTCRQCGGSGQGDPSMADIPVSNGRCVFCRGTGKVQVILPGPRRPSRIWGAVVGLDESRGAYTYANPTNIRMVPLAAPLMPAEMSEIAGALGGAKLVFTGAATDPVEVSTTQGGRFSVRLAPGQYRVVVRHPGHQQLEGAVIVEPLTEPIWLEKANLVYEMTADEARSAHGLSMLAVLAHASGRGGFIRVVPSSF